MTRRRVERDDDYDREVEVEALAMQLADLIEKTLQQLDVSRAELARRMGVSKVHITQTLSGQRNLTLRTIAEALYALDHRLDAKVVPLRSRGRGHTPEVAAALERAVETLRSRKPERACVPVTGSGSDEPPWGRVAPDVLWPSERQWQHALPSEQGMPAITAFDKGARMPHTHA